MSGGLARQLADRYPGLEEEYSKICKEMYNSFDDLSGTVFWFKSDDKYIANIFSQEPNFDTNYYCLKECLKTVKKDAKLTNKAIAIPYGIGCGIANGDWNKVYKIIEEVFSDCDVTLYKIK